MKSTEDYEIHERLGAGKMGVVFRAIDRRRKEEVALKTLQRGEPAEIARFRQEFRALADVAHENLVTLYNLTALDGQWCFTMELIRGVDFKTHFKMHARGGGARRAPGRGAGAQNRGGAVDADRLRPALLQLARGIDALHRAGKLHRDIKPSNVLVDDRGRVVLVDFGLVTDLTLEPWRLRGFDPMVGTVGYMAPEQAQRRPTTEAADWYSFGVLLYEVLTGELPFDGDTDRVLIAKQERDPPPPRELAKSTPEDLNALCMDLLCREPSGRPMASEILALLERRRASSAVPFCPLPAPPFVGRSKDLADLSDAFGAMRQGRPITLLVSGASGLGKSTLVRRFTRDLARRGEAVVLEGRCYEREWVPHKTLDSLIHPLVDYLLGLPPTEVADLIPNDAPLLADVFKTLKSVPIILARSAEPRAPLPDAQELRRRVFGAFIEILRRIGARAPLVLVIDDLQWGDADGVGPLTDLFAPPSPLPALLIGCFRDADAATSPPLQALLSRWDSSGSVACELRMHKLEPMTASESQELLNLLVASDAPIPAALGAAITEKAAGSPFLVQELAEYVRLKSSSGRGAAASIASVRRGDVLNERIAMLSEEERRLLEVIALAAYPLPEDAAIQAANVTCAPSNALSRLRNLRLLLSRPTETTILLEPYHDGIREPVVEGLPPEVRRRRHSDLARTLEAWPDTEPQLLAEHYREAGDLGRAVHFTLTAAERASGALAFNRAAKLYQLALDLGAGPQARWELLAKRGEAQANAGKGKEAASSFADAAAELGADASHDNRVLDLKRNAIYQYLRSGYVDEGTAMLRSVLAALGDRYPKTPRAALASILLLRTRLKVQLRTLEARISSPEAKPTSEKDRVRLETYYAAGLGLSLVDNIRATHFQLLYELLALRTGNRTHLARGLAAQVAFLAAEGGASKRRQCSKILGAAEELAQSSGDPHVQALACLCGGVAAFYRGAWRTALDRCREAERIGRERCAGVTWERNCAEQVELWSLAYLGELLELSKRLPELLKEARERDDALAATSLRLGMPNMAWLAEDRPEEAEEQAADAMRRWTPASFTSQHYLEVIARSQAELYRGDGLAAYHRVEDAWPKLDRAFLLRLQAVRIELRHLRARAALAAAEALPDQKAPGKSNLSRRRLLREAITEVRCLASEDLAIAAPFAAMLRAGIASLSDDEDAAAGELHTAALSCARSEMNIYAASARLWYGSLLGGDEGAKYREESAAWMREHGVANPVAMAALLVPGFQRFL